MARVHRMTIKEHNGILGPRKVMRAWMALVKQGKINGEELYANPLFPETAQLCKIRLSNLPSTRVPRTVGEVARSA